jgi:hypothetical protein
MGVWTRLQGMEMGSCSHSNDIYLHTSLLFASPRRGGLYQPNRVECMVPSLLNSRLPFIAIHAKKRVIHPLTTLCHTMTWLFRTFRGQHKIKEIEFFRSEVLFSFAFMHFGMIVSSPLSQCDNLQ